MKERREIKLLKHEKKERSKKKQLTMGRVTRSEMQDKRASGSKKEMHTSLEDVRDESVVVVCWQKIRKKKVCDWDCERVGLEGEMKTAYSAAQVHAMKKRQVSFMSSSRTLHETFMCFGCKLEFLIYFSTLPLISIFYFSF